MQTSLTSVYRKPLVNQLGSFEQITLGGQFSGSIDAVYPVGTPSTVPVFS